MAGTLKTLANETALYGLSSIIGRVANFLLVPYYTGVFAPGEYGIVIKLYAFVVIFNVLLSHGMETAYFRFASEKREDEGKLFNASISSIFLVSLVICVVLFLSADQLASLLNYEGKGIYIKWLALIIAIDALVAIPFARLRLEGRPLKFAITRLTSVFLNIGLNLILITLCTSIYRGEILPSFKPLVDSFYNPNQLVGYVFLANLIANAAYFVLLRKEISAFKFEWDWQTMKPLYQYAIPLLFMGLAASTNEVFSRVSFEDWLPINFYPFTNKEAIGMFGACFKLSVFMALGVQAFKYAWEPFFFKRAKDAESPQLFAKVMTWFVVFTCVVFFAIVANLDLLKVLLLRDESYWAAIDIVPILLLANLLLGIYYSLSLWYKLTDKTIYATYMALGGAILTILLNWFLIPAYGFIGAATATLVVYGSLAVTSYVLGQKHYPIPYNLGKILTYLAISSLLAFAWRKLPLEDTFAHFTFGIIASLLFAGLVFLLERKELQKDIKEL